MLSVWFCELEKQIVFQLFKNGWLLRNFKKLHFRKKKKSTDFENWPKT